MSVLDRLKSVYFSAEDKYYVFLDWLNNFIPVYKVVDKIDRVFPSFILFLILVILLIIAGLYLAFTMLFASTFSVTFSVVNKVSNEPLENTSVRISFSGRDESFLTDSNGQFVLKGLQGETVELLVSVAVPEGFKPYANKPAIVSEQTRVYIIKLEPESMQLQEKTIIVKDKDSGKLFHEVSENKNEKITVQVICDSKQVAPIERFNSRILVEASVLEGCENVKAKVSASGYKDLAKPLANQETTFMMEKEAAVKAVVIVNLKEEGTGIAVANVSVSIFTLDSSSPKGTQASKENGSARFEVSPGTYFVKAVDNDVSNGKHDGNTSSNFTVGAGDAETITLTLKKVPVSRVKELHLKIIDSYNLQAVSQAEITVFDANDNSRLGVTVSRANGKAEFAADSNKVYNVVVQHANFVVKAVSAVRAVLKDSAEYTEIKLDAAVTGVNFGRIRVAVLNEELNGVNNAVVEVFNSSFLFPMAVSSTGTGNNGIVLFSQNFPPGTYFARALSSDLQETGVSDINVLSAGRILDLNVMLVIGNAPVSAIVKNTLGLGIENADVNFYDFAKNSEFIAKQLTSAQGRTPELSLKVDKKPFITAWKQGFYKSTVPAKRLFKTIPAVFQTTLFEQGSFDSFDLELESVRNGERIDEIVSKIQKNKPYWIEFRLELPQRQQQVQAHVRVGRDSVLNVSDSELRAVIEDALSTAVFLKSPLFNPLNAFDNSNAGSGMAKQVNFDFGSLDFGSYAFFVKTLIKDGLADGSEIEVHYTAKNALGKIKDKVRVFKINELFCISNANCPELDFAVSVSNLLTGDTNELGIGDSLKIMQGTPYALNFTVLNNSKKTFSNVTASLSTIPNSVDFNPASIDLGRIGVDERVSGRVDFNARLEGTALFELMLNVDSKDKNFTAFFNIMPKGRLKVMAPRTFPPRIAGSLGIVVEDKATNERIANASVQAFINQNPAQNSSNPLLSGFFTDSEGTAFLPFSGLNSGTIIYIMVSKPGFQDEIAETIVATQFGISPIDHFKCLTVSPLILSTARGLSKNFTITANNCLENVELTIQTSSSIPADAAPIIDKMQLQLQNNSETIKVTAGQWLGEYPVFVRGKFQNSDTQYYDVNELVLFVTDSAGCFSIDKTAFNIGNQEDSGVITNNCFLQSMQRTTEIPALKLTQTDKAGIRKTGASGIEGQVSFNWRIKASVQEVIILPALVPFETDKVFGFSFSGAVEGTPSTGVLETLIETPTAERIDSVTSLQLEAFVKPTSAEESDAGFPNNLPLGRITGKATVVLRDTIGAGSMQVDIPAYNAPEILTEAGQCPDTLPPCVHWITPPVSLQGLNIKSISGLMEDSQSRTFFYWKLHGKVVRDSLTTSENFFTFNSNWTQGIVIPGFKSNDYDYAVIGQFNLSTLNFTDTPSYKGGFIKDVNLAVETDNPEINAYLRGNEVKAKHVGLQTEYTGILPFSIFNIGLEGTEYGMIEIEDYVNK